jgi:hypothetical protein
MIHNTPGLTLSDVFRFLVDVILLLNVERSHESADPYNKSLVLSFEEVDGFVDLLVNLHRQLDPDLMGQLLNEVHHVFRLAQVVVLDRAHKPVVEFCLEFVLLLDLVKHLKLLFQLRLVLVVVLDN